MAYTKEERLNLYRERSAKSAALDLEVEALERKLKLKVDERDKQKKLAKEMKDEILYYHASDL